MCTFLSHLFNSYPDWEFQGIPMVILGKSQDFYGSLKQLISVYCVWSCPHNFQDSCCGHHPRGLLCPHVNTRRHSTPHILYMEEILDFGSNPMDEVCIIIIDYSSLTLTLPMLRPLSLVFPFWNRNVLSPISILPFVFCHSKTNIINGQHIILNGYL